MDVLNSITSLPKHLGIIMDGNRRWAKKRFLPSFQGHSKGAEAFKSVCVYCNKIGIKYLTVYALSTENWKRSEEEITYLLKLFRKYLLNVLEKKFGIENIKINFIGDITKFPSDIKNLMEKIQKESANNTGLQLNVAMNYGGRNEIVSAVRKIVSEVQEKKINSVDITEDYFSDKLYTSNQPDVDLIIRTADEKRLSNFLLWQSAYAEFYFTSTLWPDFNEIELNKALHEYNRRIRRFGGA